MLVTVNYGHYKGGQLNSLWYIMALSLISSAGLPCPLQHRTRGLLNGYEVSIWVDEKVN